MISALTKSYNFFCTSTDPNQLYMIVMTYCQGIFTQSHSTDINVHTFLTLQGTIYESIACEQYAAGRN
jgi:hypothetical protein